jgi:hypothetical protein
MEYTKLRKTFLIVAAFSFFFNMASNNEIGERDSYVF